MKDQPFQPIFIMPENTKRSQGKDAQRLNIAAAKIVGETVRTTLGPKGMDKMIVDANGSIIVTNDGATILKEMNIEHPTARMVVEIAKTQETEVGDGTTTAVVLAAEFLRKAEELLDQDVHPTVIARGYRFAAEKSMNILENMAEPCTEKNIDLLRKIALTAMTGKGAESSKEQLTELVLQAVKRVMELRDGKSLLDRYAIRIEKRTGAAVEDSELIEGLVIDKEKIHPQMPTKVKDARILLLDAPLEVKSTEIDTKIQITDPSKLQAFLDMEEDMLRRMVEKVARAGANVLFCQKGIDDLAQHYLSKFGIYAVRRVKKSDIESLAKATGGRIIMNLDDIAPEDVGFAGLVEEVRINDAESMTFVRECRKAKTVTILVRGGSEHLIDEIKRALEDAIGDISAALSNNKVLPGAGAVEIELSRELYHVAHGLTGREQLAVRAYAQSLEIIPRTLAENAGLDPIDVLAELKSAHVKKMKNAGINVFTGKVMDAWKQGVIEPLKIKTQAISSATEVAIMILRIDDVILGGRPEPTQKGAGQQDMREM
jgi:thermosome